MAHPRDIYLHYSPYLELFTGVSTALSINEGIIKVVGPEGSGKTAFCRQLEEHLIQQGQDVIYFESPPESSDYLFGQIQTLLGLDKNRNFNKCLTEYLVAKSAPDNKLYVIYDDAEKIDKELFILIRLLNNIHNDSETLVSQVICGTDKLDELFDDPDLRSLTQYLNQSFTLPPMNRNELEDFCSGYKKETENKGRQLSSKELTDIFMLSKGLPGKTLELLEEALAPEFVESKPETAKEPASIIQEQEAKEETVDDIPVLEEDIPESEEAASSSGQDNTVDVQAPETTTEEVAITEDVPVDFESQETESPEIKTPEIVEQTQTSQEPETEPEDEVPLFEDEAEIVAAFTREDASQDDAEMAQIDALPDPAYSNTDSAENMQEINSILAKEPELRRGMNPLYFKVTLSVIVVVVTMILAVVLSGENETVNNQLARIFAEETPLYMDQVAQDNNQVSTTESANNDVVIAESDDADVVIINPPAQPVEEIPETELIDAQIDIPANIAPSENELPVTQDVSTDTVLTASEAIVPAETTDSTASDEMVSEELPDEEPALEEPVSEQSIEVELAGTITRWLDAWENGNIESYLSSYHENYIPSYVESYTLWENQRRERIEGATGINTDFDRLEILETTQDEITIQFWLYYSRDSYMDETLKELRLGMEDGNWAILEERNIEVIVDR